MIINVSKSTHESSFSCDITSYAYSDMRNCQLSDMVESKMISAKDAWEKFAKSHIKFSPDKVFGPYAWHIKVDVCDLFINKSDAIEYITEQTIKKVLRGL